MYSASMFNNADGTSDINGTIKIRCWTDGGENDTNNDYISTNQVENGRICLLESVHTS